MCFTHSIHELARAQYYSSTIYAAFYAFPGLKFKIPASRQLRSRVVTKPGRSAERSTDEHLHLHHLPPANNQRGGRAMAGKRG